MIPFMKVVYYDPEDGEHDLTPYVLSMQISKGSEATKNTVTIELQNHDGLLTNADRNAWEFTVAEASIVVYLDWQPIDEDTISPIISANVSSLEYPTDANGKYKIKVKATDKTAMLLSKMWAQANTESENRNASEIIVNLVGHLNDLDGEGKTTMGKTPLTTDNVATTKQDGSALKRPVVMSKVWKPGYEWLNDLSQTESTGEDRPYIYYVDEFNDLHWHYPFQKPETQLSSSINSSVTTIPVTSTTGYPDDGLFVIGDEIISYESKDATNFLGCTRGDKFTNSTSHDSGTTVSGLFLYLGKQDIYKLDIGTTEDGTYNFIIYNAGPTPAGYDYLFYDLDEAQVGKKFRMKFFNWESIGKDMLSEEKRRDDVAWPDADDDYPTGSYPWTPVWSSTSVADDDEYQTSFETEARRRAEVACKAYYVTGKQKYTASAQLRGTTDYQVGDIVQVSSPKFDLLLTLRVKEVKHQVNKTGWITSVEMTEDVDAISTT
jgi:hypothetical protein